MYGQPFSGKLYTAIFLAIVAAVIFVLAGYNLLQMALYGAFIAAGMMGGFYIAPLIFRMGDGKLSKLKKVMDKVDAMEQKVAGEPAQTTKEAPPAPEKKEETTEDASNENTSENPDTKEDSDEKKDWRGGIKDFLDK